MQKFFRTRLVIAGFIALICGALNGADNPPPTVGPRIIDGVLQPQTSFPSVGLIGDVAGTFTCTGTLIDPRHVLTAGHCGVAEGSGGKLPDNGATFTLNGKTIRTSKIFLHPTFSSTLVGQEGVIDAAIFELETAVTDVAPSPINRTVPTIGMPVTLVGLGLLGTDKTPFKKTPPSGKIAVGTNSIDTISPDTIGWTFTPGTSSNAPGDSGGPAFINVNGTMAIAGITSLGETTGGNRVKFGATNIDTRIDVLAPWIDAVLTGMSTNAPPSFTSTISISPNPATTNEAVNFGVSATDPDNANIFYIWDFGDGAGGSGPTTMHAYDFPGNYTIGVTISDLISGVTSNANVVVQPAGVGSLSVDKLRLGLNFQKFNGDSVAITAHVTPVPVLGALPTLGELIIDTVKIPFLLDSKGHARSTGLNVTLNVKKSTITLTYRNADFSGGLANTGITNSTVTKKPVMAPVTFYLNGIQYSATRQLLFTGKQDRTGSAQ